MTILEHPEAVSLLADATVSTEAVRDCRAHLARFLKRYLPSFYREEQRGHAAAFVRGLLGGLERKSVEPIARQAGIPRKDLRMFVGQGAWDDEAVGSEMRRHVAEELGEPTGVIVLDPSGFPRKGDESCGVARQWCGRQGKIDNGQLGVFVAYVSSKGHAPLGRRLYLPKDWADDPARREAPHVPEDVTYQKTREIAADLLDRGGARVPHGWVVGDDEFGRPSEFRELLRERGERYLLDVPCNTSIRDPEGDRPAKKPGRYGKKPEVPSCGADTRAASLPAGPWTKPTIRDGTKGPMVVEAVAADVLTRRDRRVGPEERPLVIRSSGPKPEVIYALSNAKAEVSLAELVGVRSQRHRVERVFQEAKGEVGLSDYEVRSRVGWHHHITLSLLALWSLILERRRIGGENPGGDGLAGEGDLHPTAPPRPTDVGRDRRGDQRSATA